MLSQTGKISVTVMTIPVTNRRHLLKSIGIALVCQVLPATAQAVVQPPRGSTLRKDILDGVRSVFEVETNGEVEFVVRRLNVLSGWAFGDVTLQRPGGRPIDWKRTKFAEAHADGAFDPAGSFFLARRTNQGWRVITFAVGPTDIAWDTWDKEYGAPRAVFDRGTLN